MRASYKGIKAVTLGVVFTALAGCAGTKVMDQAQLQQVKSVDKINVVYHGPIGPAVQTAGNAIKFEFSMGLAGWGTPGLQIMGENGIEDPLVTMRKQLMDRLAAEAQLQNLVVGESPVPHNKTKPADIQEAYGEGLYLQLIPAQWTVIYYATNFSRYHMYYGAMARLVRADDGEVLWSARCQANQGNKDNAPSMNQLMANKAERLKDWTDQAAQQCADQLADRFVGKVG